MASRVMQRLKGVLQRRNIEYTQENICFEHDNKRYEVRKLIGENKYRLSIHEKGKPYVSEQDFSAQRMYDLISRIINELEGDKNGKN